MTTLKGSEVEQMPSRREVWVELAEAVAIASEVNAHPVAPGYIRTLASQGKIASKPKDGRTNLYLKSDIKKLRITPKPRKGKENERQPEE